MDGDWGPQGLGASSGTTEGEVEQSPELVMPHLVHFPLNHRDPWDGWVFPLMFYR